MKPLHAHLPPKGETLTAEVAFDRFVTWASDQGLSLYPAQEEALLELFGGKHLVLATPTGSGKSLVAMGLHFLCLARGQTSFYTCPIKALVNEKFFALCEAFGPENVGLMTGDATVNRGAPIVCCTAEILSNQCLRESRQFADAVVMDEFHYYGDKDRGVAWQIPLLMLDSTRFLLMSATLGDTRDIQEALKQLTGVECAEVRSADRPVPLDFSYAETPLHETIGDLLKANRAPIYLVNFSQRAAAEEAQSLLSIDVCTKEEKEKLKDQLYGTRFDTPFGKELAKLLRHGIGLHHAGLLPRYRRLVERLAQQGLLKVVSGTDTLGVGVNVPLRTVLFTQLCKFDGEKTGVLTVRDFLQIAGRAGRKGFDTQGYVVAQAPAHVIENKRLQQKKDAGKKVVLQKPPTKGYAHWDAGTFDRLCTHAPEALESRFSVSHGLIVNLLQASVDSAVGGYRKLVVLIGKSHTQPGTKTYLLKRSAQLVRSLIGAGVVVHERRTGTMPAHLLVAPGLQKEFSLNQTLSLYVVEALQLLDAASPTYALDVLSLVESVLENPDLVLWAQLDKAKGEKVAELKAQGVEYDKRMEELEKVEYPKPLAELIYGSFDSFAAKHPWVGHENVKPKSVARELFELAATFNDYVKEYGISRGEGVLLRYLTDAYKTLLQNVPESMRDEVLADVLAFLRATVRSTDASLLEEWEAMRSGQGVERVVAPSHEPKAPPKLDLAQHPRALAARVRAELHRLVRVLAMRQYEEALELLAHSGGWTAERLEAEMKPYWDAHPAIDTTPRARAPHLTQMAEDEPRVWTARQSVLDPTGESDFFLECVVDLRGRNDPDEPLIDLRRVGG
jgi:superfamily II RNA helicase